MQLSLPSRRRLCFTRVFVCRSVCLSDCGKFA